MEYISSSMGTESLETECAKAEAILQAMLTTQTGCGPTPDVLKNCVGLAFLRINKAGLLVTGSYGTGVVVVRRGADGAPCRGGAWSHPSAISSKSVGSGVQAGAQVLESLVVINTPEAVEAFVGGSLMLGTALEMAVGPTGTGGEIPGCAGEGLVDEVPCYAYALSSGLFAGISLEGVVLNELSATNAAFYGAAVEGRRILDGTAALPAALAPVDRLHAALAAMESLWAPATAPQ